MAGMREGSSRDRSVSVDSDVDATGPGKPGRKKNPNSQAARRDQNRIAQREFRLRKQQRIRDLEARVEILSGGQDEAISEMRNILKDLMEENHTLRSLLRSLSSFIGDGAGGLLPKLGWTMADFNGYVNKSETDTAWESYQRRKVAAASASVSDTSQNHQTQKRLADTDNPAIRSKKSREAGEQSNESEHAQERFNVLMHMPPGVVHHPPAPMYHSSTRPHDSGMFPDLMRSSGSSPMLMQTSSPTYPQAYMPPMTVNLDSSLPPPPFPATNPHGQMQQRLTPGSQAKDPAEDDNDTGKSEEHKLIQYHLNNYKRNSGYHLPASLRPTLVQRTIPHQSVIDSILHPDLRDRMILLNGRFDLAECLMEFRSSVTIHGDDVLAHTNWEIGEPWLRRYGFLVDQSTLSIANLWRRERGEPELRLSDLAPPEHTPEST